MNHRRVLCLLGLSSSGYYGFLKRQGSGPTEQETRRATIKARISKIHTQSHEIYGAPKICHELRKEGYKVSERTVGNYMRKMGLKAHYIKPYTVTTIDSSTDAELRNILDRQFNPDEPNAYWCSDITYIWTAQDGFVYLTSVMDLFSRKILAWELSDTLEAEIVLRCIDRAIARRRGCRPKICHTDRGAQYISYSYHEKLGQEVATSYSRTANPWDNACIESFHALIKREWLYRYEIYNYDHAKQLVFQYIDAFYNTVRSHSHCGYLSPNDYEEQHYRQQREETRDDSMFMVNLIQKMAG